jgi:hypothetical protein
MPGNLPDLAIDDRDQCSDRFSGETGPGLFSALRDALAGSIE